MQFEKKPYRFFSDVSGSLGSRRQPQYSGMDWFRQHLQQEGFMDAGGRVIENRQPAKTLVSLTGTISRVGQTWFRTGNPALPPLMKELLDKNRRLLGIPERLNEMQPRAAWDVHEWDLLEELPVWTDQDRLDITNSLLRDAAVGHERRAFHKQVEDGAVMAMDENHGTHSALNSFMAWHYFHKYYPSAASRYWMRCAEALFAGQASTYQIPEDAAGYLCSCPIHAMDYSLRVGDPTYFRREVARHHARYIAMACINNLGLSTGFGDAPSLVCPEFFEAIAPAAWWYRDPELSWVVRNKLPAACGLRIFQRGIALDLTVEPREPTDWTGLTRIPLYEVLLPKGTSSKTPVWADKKDVDPKLFNKLVFRENWDENGQYLLLDGAGAGGNCPGPKGHTHQDINTIINFTQCGRMWLVDHTYPLRAAQEHSGLYVLRDGVGGYRKNTLAELLDFVDTETYGLSRTRLANWERAVFWKKGKYFLVIDTVAADRQGDYFARCSWRALGKAELRGTALQLTQNGRFCKIVTDGAANLDIERYQPADAQWKAYYPHAEPIVRILQEDKRRSLNSGEKIGFVNLLYAYGSNDAEARVQLQPVSETCAIVTEDGRETLLGVGPIPGGLGAAGMFVLSEDVTLRASAAKEFEQRPETARKALAAARELAAQRAGKAAPTGAEPEVQGLRVESVRLDVPITVLAVADIRGDGTRQWVIGGEKGVSVFRTDGTKVWHFAMKQTVRSLDVADVDGDGRPEIAVGGMDEHVRLLDGHGKQRWSYPCKKSTGSLDGPPVVDYVKIVDLRGDGTKEIVAGANWVQVLGATGELKWEKYMDFRRGQICGDFIAGDVADLDGDGKQEIVALFMTSYPWAVVYDALGNIVMPLGSADHRGLNIDVPFAAATLDLLGNRTRQIVCGCTSQMGFLWRDQKNKEEAGGWVRGAFVALACRQRGATRQPMAFGADGFGGVRGILPDARPNDRRIGVKTAWYRNIGEKVTTLLAADLLGNGAGQVVAGTKAGNAYLLDAKDGAVIGLVRSSGPPVTSLVVDPSARSVLVGKSDGTVLRISVRK